MENKNLGFDILNISTKKIEVVGEKIFSSIPPSNLSIFYFILCCYQ